MEKVLVIVHDDSLFSALLSTSTLFSNAAPPVDHSKVQCTGYNRLVEISNILLHLWKISASSGNRVCSSLSCTQHQCWFSTAQVLTILHLPTFSTQGIYIHMVCSSYSGDLLFYPPILFNFTKYDLISLPLPVVMLNNTFTVKDLYLYRAFLVLMTLQYSFTFTPSHTFIQCIYSMCSSFSIIDHSYTVSTHTHTGKLGFSILTKDTSTWRMEGWDKSGDPHVS